MSHPEGRYIAILKLIYSRLRFNLRLCSGRGAGWPVVVLSVVLVTLHWQRRTEPFPAGSDPDPAGHSCRDVFRLTRRRYRWDPAAVAGCLVRPLQASAVGDRLRLRAAATGRPTQLVFIGDSRTRIIYSRIIERLGLEIYQRSSDEPLPGSPAASNLTGAPANCTEAFHQLLSSEKRLDAPLTLRHPCSRRAEDESLQMHFWYRPYMTRSFDTRATTMAAQCSSQPDTCPALVIINAGAWYARRFSLTLRASAADWVLHLRRDAASRRPTLRRLAAATSVVWKLEDPMFTREVEGTRPDVISSVLMVMQAVTYDEAARVPGLTVWSGALPESGRYERRMCGSWPRRPGEPKKAIARETGDCRDAIHVGSDVLDGQTDAIFDYLYQGSAVRSPDSQFCCGAS